MTDSGAGSPEATGPVCSDPAAEENYGFEAQPFHVTPDARMVFTHRRYEEALSALHYAVMKGKGFAVITGEVGAGKTTLLRHYVSMLDPSVRYAVIFNTWLGGAELLSAIADDLGVQSPAIEEKPLNRKALLDAINDFLIEQFQQGHEVVVFIDEAQNLSTEALESLRMLSNLETETEKLIQIILLGQPELQEVLSREELKQLRSRIAVAYHLSPMDAEETASYVAHRIAVAKPKKPVSFSTNALKALHRYSGGSPRIINIVCDQCLVAGGETQAEVIDRDLVESVIAGFDHLDHPGRGRFDLRSLIVTLPLVIAVGVFAGAAMSAYWARDRSPHVTTPVVVAPAATIVPAAPESSAAGAGQTSTEISPLRKLVASYAVPAQEGYDQMTMPAIASAAGLAAIETRLDAATIEAIGLPAILLPGNPVLLNHSAAVITRSEGGMWTVETLENGILSVPAPGFDVPVSYLIPSRPWMSRTISQRAAGAELKSAQEALIKAGLLSGHASGRYDRRTSEAIRNLQARYRLPTDGVIGPVTSLALYAEEKKAAAR